MAVKKLNVETISRTQMTQMLLESHVSERVDVNTKMGGIIDVFIESFSQLISEGAAISLKNIGTLSKQFKEAREGVRNPKTGEEATLDSRYVVTLKKSLKHDNKYTIPRFVAYVTPIIEEQLELQIKESEVRAIYTEFMERIRAVEEGKYRVEFRKFGVFTPVMYTDRVSRNPQTGETVYPEDKIKIKYSISSTLHKLINEEEAVA